MQLQFFTLNIQLICLSYKSELKSCLCSVAVGKLMELHGEGGAGTTAKASGDDTGAKVERADGYEPPIQETV